MWTLLIATAGATELISVAMDGGPGNGESHGPAIMSEDGRYVVFVSEASDLVPDDDNDEMDVFLRDRVKQTTIRLSPGNGRSGACLSYPDGTWIANVDITPDGSYVVFTSDATNIANGYSEDEISDSQTVYSWNSNTDLIYPVSYYDDPKSGFFEDKGCWPSVQADGEVISFISLQVSYDQAFEEDDPGPNDNDVYVADSFGFNAVSHANGDFDEPDGEALDRPTHLSANGEWLVYEARDRTGQPQQGAVLYDMLLFETSLVGLGYASQPGISGDGTTIVFSSMYDYDGQDIDPSRPDVFREDRISGEITRVSVRSDGTVVGGTSEYPYISDNGEVIVFQSNGEIIDGHTFRSIFAHHIATGETVLVSQGLDGEPGSGELAAVSPDGEWVTFRSSATDLVDGDDNGVDDIFITRSDGSGSDPDPDPGDTGDPGDDTGQDDSPYEDPGVPDGLADLSVEIESVEGFGTAIEIGLYVANPDSSDDIDGATLTLAADILEDSDAGWRLVFEDDAGFDCETDGLTATCELEVVPFDWNRTMIARVETEEGPLPTGLRELGYDVLADLVVEQKQDPFLDNNSDSLNGQLELRKVCCGELSFLGVFFVGVFAWGRRERW